MPIWWYILISILIATFLCTFNEIRKSYKTQSLSLLEFIKKKKEVLSTVISWGFIIYLTIGMYIMQKTINTLFSSVLYWGIFYGYFAGLFLLAITFIPSIDRGGIKFTIEALKSIFKSKRER